MKKTLLMISIAALLAGLTIIGCRKDDTTAPSDQPPAGVTDESSAMANAASSDQYVTDATDVYAFSDAGIAPTNYSDATSLSKTDTAIIPLRWGRFINSVTRNINVTVLPGDTLAYAHVSRVVSGTLKIRTTLDGADTVFTKAFTDTTGKNVIFMRRAHDPKKFWLNWVPVATSLIVGGTNPMPANNGIQITKVQLYGGGDSITVTNPEDFWLRYQWIPWLGPLHHRHFGDVPQFSLGDSVGISVTLLSQSSDTDMVAIRSGFGLQAHHFLRARMTLVSQSGPDANGFYTKVYAKTIRVPYTPGSFHVGIDAITRATLYDSSAPYSASWWGVPSRMY